MLALAAAFFAKFAKVIAVGAVALAGGAYKFWRRKSKPAPVAAPTMAAPMNSDTPPKAEAKDS